MRKHLSWTRKLGLCMVFSFPIVLSGCRKDREPVCPAFKPAWAPVPTEEDPAVAMVNGVPILKSQLAGYIGEFPDCEERDETLQEQTDDERPIEDPDEPCRPSPREALQHLVDMELLAQKARKLGYMDHEALLAAKKTAAYKVLEETFEREHQREHVPTSLLRQAYKLNIRRFVRPELRTFSHILVVFPAKDSKKRKKVSGKESGPSEKDPELLAEKLSRAIHEKAVELEELGKLDRDVFFEIHRKMKDESNGFTLRAERGTAAEEQLVPEFAQLLFGLEKTGTVAGPVKTRFGFHVIFLEEIQPAIDRPFEEAKEEVLDNVFPEYRQSAFERYLKKLEQACPVKIHIENIPHASTGCKSEHKPTRETAKDHGI